MLDIKVAIVVGFYIRKIELFRWDICLAVFLKQMQLFM